MNNIELCKTEEQKMCIADYERDTRNELLATKSILNDIYATIVGGESETQKDEGVPNCMIENARMTNDIAEQNTRIADAIRRELFGR